MIVKMVRGNSFTLLRPGRNAPNGHLIIVLILLATLPEGILHFVWHLSDRLSTRLLYIVGHLLQGLAVHLLGEVHLAYLGGLTLWRLLACLRIHPTGSIQTRLLIAFGGTRATSDQADPESVLASTVLFQAASVSSMAILLFLLEVLHECQPLI